MVQIRNLDIIKVTAPTSENRFAEDAVEFSVNKGGRYKLFFPTSDDPFPQIQEFKGNEYGKKRDMRYAAVENILNRDGNVGCTWSYDTFVAACQGFIAGYEAREQLEEAGKVSADVAVTSYRELHKKLPVDSRDPSGRSHGIIKS